MPEDGEPFSKSVDLLPGETLVTEACANRTVHGDDLGSFRESSGKESHGAVGIALTSDAMPGSFAAFGLARNVEHNNRFFSAITFIDPKMMMSPNTVFPGVPVGRSSLLAGGRYVPELALANFSPRAVQVRVSYAQTSGGSSASSNDVATFKMNPGTTKALSFKELSGDPGLRNSFVVYSDAAAGNLIAKIVSKTDGRFAEVELLGKDEKDPQNGGKHPWSVEQGADSTLLLFNHGSATEDFAVVIAAGDVVWQKAYTLASKQTEAIDIRQLIRDQVKDTSGQKLPKNVQSGQVTWYGAGTGKGRLMISNPDAAMAHSFSCGAKLILCGVSFTAGSTTIPQGSTVPFGSASTQMCDASLTPPGSCAGDAGSGTCFTSQCTYAWSSAAPSIAGISGAANGIPVSVTGFTQGTTTVNGNVLDRASACQFIAHGTAKVQKPGFLQVSNVTTSLACTNSLGCAKDIQYRVLDVNASPMAIPNLTVRETVTKVGGCSNVSLSDAGVWTTDANGALKGTDILLACAPPNSTLTCTLTYNQTFTVNGFGVLLLSSDKTKSGTTNVITLPITNGVSACPNAVITP